MGGRGSASPGSSGRFILARQEELPYNVVGGPADGPTGEDDALGGAVYPFLEQAGRAWRLLTRPVGEEVDYHPLHTFGKEGELRPPTLRWVNGDQVNDLYVDGMDTEQFLAATGLRLDLHKGAFVLSKRLSRLMRPHFVSGFFGEDEVRVAYMEQDEREAKIWDGAALISRRMLEKMASDDGLLERLGPAKRDKVLYELERAGRVEFTVMGHSTSGFGQDKGHAIVAEELHDDEGNPVDFLLPRDTKREVRLENGQTFVGLSFVHGHDHMRLDIQSLINLHPFFDEEQLLGWLHDEGELFVRSVENGTAGDVMARIDKHTTLADVQSWPLREYLASGGHPLWFRSHVKSLMNQHLQRLNHSTLEKMRLPIPGGRYYVMPAAAGRRAGVLGAGQEGPAVGRGEIKVDPRYGTAWVNDEDWLSLADAPQETGKPAGGIADILGGADHDDALWLYPFTDYDGERKVLAWRSPNQVGEYVILKPTADSAYPAGSWTPSWRMADGGSGEEIVFPAGDSRRLPARVDRTETAYLNLVDANRAGSYATAGGLGEGEAYTIAVMDAAVERALANRGALGMYCNSLMVNKALFGRLPDTPPAPLEAVIDSAVKTGADLSAVVAWNYENARQILEAGVPVPALLHHRLSVDYADKENRPPLPVASTDHWLDGLEAGVRTHIQQMIRRRDELVARATPPTALFDSVAGEPELVAQGAKLNQVYARALKRAASATGVDAEGRLEAARQAVEAHLAQYPPGRRGPILRGALVSAYMNEEPVSDVAVWLAGPKVEGEPRAAGVGHLTAGALREIGLLDEIVETDGGLLVYPNAAPEMPVYQTIGINGVWFNWHRRAMARQGRPAPVAMGDVPKTDRRRAKQRVARLVQNEWREIVLHIRGEKQKSAYTVDGQRVGTISQVSQDQVNDGDVVRLRLVMIIDGDIRAAYENVLE